MHYVSIGESNFFFFILQLSNNFTHIVNFNSEFQSKETIQQNNSKQKRHATKL